MRRLLTTLAVVLVAIMPMWAKYDAKFFKKAAEKVWGMSLSDFDARKEIPDSLYKDESAVIIAAYSNVEVKRVEQLNANKYSHYGKAFTNAIDMKYFTRIMIKLKDKKAVEDYSEFNIDTKGEEGFAGYSYQYTSSAFGARVIKPDGTVIDVDCSKAFDVKEGKKNKTVERIVAIPGLEPGDVLEYFYYDEVWLDEFDLDPFVFSFSRKYPMMYYKIHCSIDPELTVEYRNYNGAPLLTGFIAKNQTRVLGVEAINIPKREAGAWMSPKRQFPFIKMYVMNNQRGSLAYKPKSARIGVYCALPADTYYTDISNVLTDVTPTLTKDIVSDATKIMKDYVKLHPEAKKGELVNAAWLATMYSGLRDDKSHNSMTIPLYFSDVLKRLNIKENVRVGVTNSRDEVPISAIISWREPDYIGAVGDTCYIVTNELSLLPGELPGEYCGEQAALFDYNGEDYNKQKATLMVIPTTRAAENSATSEIEVSFNEEDNNILNISRQMSLKGAMKTSASSLVDYNAWMRAVENYLEIPEKKRAKLKIDSAEVKARFDELFKEDAEAWLGVVPSTIHNYNITSIGGVPNQSTLDYNMKCEVDGLVKRAGSDLVVSLGRLIGEQYKVEGEERNRKSHIFRSCPNLYRHTISLEIPQGYTVTEESLQLLNKSVSNDCGMFISQAKVTNNVLTLKVQERYVRYFEPIERWPMFLDLIDASAAYSNAVVILTKQ